MITCFIYIYIIQDPAAGTWPHFPTTPASGRSSRRASSRLRQTWGCSTGRLGLSRSCKSVPLKKLLNLLQFQGHWKYWTSNEISMYERLLNLNVIKWTQNSRFDARLQFLGRKHNIENITSKNWRVLNVEYNFAAEAFDYRWTYH